MDAVKKINPKTVDTDIREFLAESEKWELPEGLNANIHKASIAKALKENNYTPKAKIKVSTEKTQLGIIRVKILINDQIFTGAYSRYTESAFFKAISEISQK